MTKDKVQPVTITNAQIFSATLISLRDGDLTHDMSIAFRAVSAVKWFARKPEQFSRYTATILVGHHWHGVVILDRKVFEKKWSAALGK